MDGQGTPELVKPPEEPVESEIPEQTPSELLKTSEPFQKFKKKRRLKWIVTVVVLIVLSVGGYFFLIKDNAKAPAQTAQDTPATQQIATQPISPTTKRFDSSDFFLSFDYPSDWTVTESPEGDKLTVKSPAVSLQDESGQTVSGQITFTIRDKDQKLPEFDKGNASSVRASEKIAYTKPGSTQRGQTYVSFLRYADSPGTGIDGIFITGDAGYEGGQAIPKADFIPVDPIISISFSSCDGACGSDPISISADSWSNKDIGIPLKEMLQSLTIR